MHHSTTKTTYSESPLVACHSEIEVNKATVLLLVDAVERGKEARASILYKNGIDLDDGDWFSQQAWLNAFREIAESLGDMNLLLIGQAIIDHAEFPLINNLEEGLRFIDVAHHMNHRLDGETMFNPETGKMIEGIGHYALTGFDAKKRNAIMVCSNPYPSKFDEGIITQIVKKFKPKGSKEAICHDLSQGSRTKGGHACTYTITW